MRKELVILSLAVFLLSCSQTEPPAKVAVAKSAAPSPTATERAPLDPAELQKRRKEIYKAYRDSIKYLAQENLKVADSDSPSDHITDIRINEAQDDGVFTWRDSSLLSDVEYSRSMLMVIQAARDGFPSGDPVLVFQAKGSGTGSWVAKEKVVVKAGSRTKTQTYDSLLSQIGDFMTDKLKLDSAKEYSLSTIRQQVAKHANEAIDRLEKKYP